MKIKKNFNKRFYTGMLTKLDNKIFLRLKVVLLKIDLTYED